jgi:predicted HNH restriction endonuclease
MSPPQVVRDSEARARYLAKCARLAEGAGCMACGFMPSPEFYSAIIQAHHTRPVCMRGTFEDGLALLRPECHRIADRLALEYEVWNLEELLPRVLAERCEELHPHRRRRAMVAA